MTYQEDLTAILRQTTWSQERLAQQLHVSHATLNSWVNGKSKPRARALEAIQKLYADVIGSGKRPTSTTNKLKVFFTTPYKGKVLYQEAIDGILGVVREHHTVVTPEDTTEYVKSLDDLQGQGLNHNQAHYAYIRQGIAACDVVVIEASQEDIRVGHELTLALLFHKPTLVLAQNNDFTAYITHDLLSGARYGSVAQAQDYTRDFLQSAMTGRADASMQTLNNDADSLHASALAKLRRLARQEPGQFGQWARDAEHHSQQVADEITASLGSLRKQPAWSVFAPIYNEDSPDYIQGGVATFVDTVLSRHGITKESAVVEAAGGTGALSRLMASKGYCDIAMFDISRPMLAEAFRLSAAMPQIKLFEADINSLRLPEPAHAIIWTDYSSNFALDQNQLASMLDQLLKNLIPGGILIFDVRTYSGWQIDFYSQPVTTFATERFQRIWLNHQNSADKIIDFDVYIRIRDADGAWAAWQRESMRERMWRLAEIRDTVNKLAYANLKAVYGDDFRQLTPGDEEPGLAYFVIEKLATG